MERELMSNNVNTIMMMLMMIKEQGCIFILRYEYVSQKGKKKKKTHVKHPIPDRRHLR